VDHLHAVSTEPARGQGGMDFRLVTHQVKRADLFVGLECPLGPLDDHPATVVATHDIHCDSHKAGRGEQNRSSPVRGRSQAPAVTVMTWRPL
jgi:hypothetical protein